MRFIHWSIIAICLVYAFWGLDIEQFLSVIAGYGFLAVVAASILTFTGFFVLGGRLFVLSSGKIGFLHSVTGTIIGQGVNNILPAKLGEVVKVAFLSREVGQPAARILGLVFWERFFDLNALLLMGFIIVFTTNSPLSIGSFSILMGIVWLTIIAIRYWPVVARTCVNWVPFELVRKLLFDLIGHLSEGLRISTVANVSVWTFILWLQYVAQVALILLWAAQLDLSLTAILVIFVVSGIGMNLAASPGGLGVYEAAIVASASWFGVAREEALASAIVLHVIQYVPTTVLGLLLMSRFNVSYKHARNDVS